jgi:hypothetical protein
MKIPRWNLRLYHWIRETVFIHPRLLQPVWYIILLRWVLMPIDSWRWSRAQKKKEAIKINFCLFGLHNYVWIGHLYELHTPTGCAVYQECVHCGKTRNIQYAMISRTQTKIANELLRK